MVWVGGPSYLDNVSKEGHRVWQSCQTPVCRRQQAAGLHGRGRNDLGLDVGSRLQMSAKSEGVSSTVQVGERISEGKPWGKFY